MKLLLMMKKLPTTKQFTPELTQNFHYMKALGNL